MISLRWQHLKLTHSPLARASTIALAVTVAGTPAWGQSVGVGVREALDAEGKVRVLVALKPPPDEARTLTARRSSVQAMQRNVLARVGPDMFEEVHHYESVAAMAGMVSREGLTELLANPEVTRIDLDAPGAGELAESVPLIRADLLQDVYGLTGAGVTVAVLDTGMDSNHPDLVNALVGEQCFCSGGGGCCPNRLPSQSGIGAARDDHFHGTHVTSIITGNGTVASVGVAPGAQIVAIKVLDRNNRFCCSSDVVAGLDWIIANRPDVGVVNMSLGTDATFAGDCDTATAFTMAFADAINALTAKGVAVFAASGNAGLPNAMKAPACVAKAISVGAVDKRDVVAGFSDSGPTLDLLAPGVAITAAQRGGGVLTLSGTSMSTPHAAGAAALLYEAYPRVNPERLVDALKKTGVPVLDLRNGLTHPRVDAEAAFLSVEACDDGIDNDLDGLIDVEDPDCPDLKITFIPLQRGKTVNLASRGLLTIGVLGSETASVADLELDSLRFGPGEASPLHDPSDPNVFWSHVKDVNHDEIPDLILHFRVAEALLSPDDPQACLLGEIGREAFRSCAAIGGRGPHCPKGFR